MESLGRYEVVDKVIVQVNRRKWLLKKLMRPWTINLEAKKKLEKVTQRTFLWQYRADPVALWLARADVLKWGLPWRNLCSILRTSHEEPGSSGITRIVRNRYGGKEKNENVAEYCIRQSIEDYRF